MTFNIYIYQLHLVALCQQIFNDIEVTEIIGTFENGLLTGPVKLKLRNGHVAIVDFVKGITRGLHR